MKNEKEYPAGHSMSTAWFAVDRDGNVALIDFSENGPVPLGTPEHLEAEELIKEIAKDGGEPFVYKQPYSFQCRLRRETSPAHPMKEDALDEKTREKAIRLPVSFGERERIQIAEYCANICGHSSSLDNTLIYKRRIYNLMTMEDGRRAYVCENRIPIVWCGSVEWRKMKGCEKCFADTKKWGYIYDTPIGIKTDTPTLLCVSGPMGRCEISDEEMMAKALYIPLIWGRPYQHREEYEERMVDFFVNCKEHFEYYVEELMPNVIVAEENAVSLLHSQYKIENGKITINGQTIPIYKEEEQEEKMEEIKRLANEEFRGKDVRRVIEVWEKMDGEERMEVWEEREDEEE